jgi:hypothetical protein
MRTGDPRIEQHGIQAPEAALRRRETILQLIRLGDIRHHTHRRGTEVGRRLFHARAGLVDQTHRRAFAREERRRGPTDAAGTPRDQRHLVFETIHSFHFTDILPTAALLAPRSVSLLPSKQSD